MLRLSYGGSYDWIPTFIRTLSGPLVISLNRENQRMTSQIDTPRIINSSDADARRRGTHDYRVHLRIE